MSPTREEKEKLKRRFPFSWKKICCSEKAVLVAESNIKATSSSDSNRHHHNHDDRKLFKKYGQRSKTVPIITSTIMMVHDHYVDTLEKIHEADKTGAKAKSCEFLAPPPALHAITSKQNIKHDQKNKNSADDARRRQCDKQNSMGREKWSDPGQKKAHLVVSMSNAKPVIEMSQRGKQCNELIVGAGQFDPMVGAVIVLLTLIVMLIWGKACAILCAAAWFYFIPRLRANDLRAYIVNTSNQIDLDSEEYKKRVVLQGFLARNHRA